MIEAKIVCDKCSKEILPDSQRVEMTVSEYGILHNPNQGYTIPENLQLHLHWACYKAELLAVVRATDK